MRRILGKEVREIHRPVDRRRISPIMSLWKYNVFLNDVRTVEEEWRKYVRDDHDDEISEEVPPGRQWDLDSTAPYDVPEHRIIP